MKYLKMIWNIITGKDKNWDGTVDIKDKMMAAKEKTEISQFKPK
jgi:hypothetical protein|tara:strand:- start:1778 stop:1909 length:132 start_codon:yes stop_codon:yes gene_type:complete